jgi:hypothetical protein
MSADLDRVLALLKNNTLDELAGDSVLCAVLFLSAIRAGITTRNEVIAHLRCVPEEAPPPPAPVEKGSWYHPPSEIQFQNARCERQHKHFYRCAIRQANKILREAAAGGAV